jgi:hypothetical protein
VRVRAVDSFGNADTCYFNMTVMDTEPPVAICPSDTTVYISSEQDSANVKFDLTADDNCDSVVVISNPPSNSWFLVGTTSVEVIATDAAGYADTCYFNITVEQTAVPIPTLSEWGMIILSLLLLAVGTMALIRKRGLSSVST